MSAEASLEGLWRWNTASFFIGDANIGFITCLIWTRRHSAKLYDQNIHHQLQ